MIPSKSSKIQQQDSLPTVGNWPARTKRNTSTTKGFSNRLGKQSEGSNSSFGSPSSSSPSLELDDSIDNQDEAHEQSIPTVNQPKRSKSEMPFSEAERQIKRQKSQPVIPDRVPDLTKDIIDIIFKVDTDYILAVMGAIKAIMVVPLMILGILILSIHASLGKE